MTARAIYTRIRQEYRAALRERAPFSDRRIRRYLRFQTESPRARAVRMLRNAAWSRRADASPLERTMVRIHIDHARMLRLENTDTTNRCHAWAQGMPTSCRPQLSGILA